MRKYILYCLLSVILLAMWFNMTEFSIPLLLIYVNLIPKIPKGYLFVDEDIKLRLDDLGNKILITPETELLDRELVLKYVYYSMKDRSLTYIMVKDFCELLGEKQ